MTENEMTRDPIAELRREVARANARAAEAELEARAWKAEAMREGCNGLTWQQIVERAVTAPLGWKYRQPRWSAVGVVFSVGSTTARELCRAFGRNPDEERRHRMRDCQKQQQQRQAQEAPRE